MEKIKKYKLVKNKNYSGFIQENCNVCGCEMHKVEDILVYVDNDSYVCRKCVEELGLEVNECGSLYSEEEI